MDTVTVETLHLYFWGGRQSIFICTKDNCILLGKGMKFVTVQICIETCVNVEQEKRQMVTCYSFLVFLLQIHSSSLCCPMLGGIRTLQTCFPDSITNWLSVRFC